MNQRTDDLPDKNGSHLEESLTSRSHKRIEKKGGYFKSFDGTPIYYEVRGQGPPLVFVYGIVSTTNNWRHQLNEFSQNYTTVVLDFRGHHNTPVPKNFENLSIDSLAQDLKALCAHLNIKKACFCGHSFGVQVLIRGYDLFPHLFSKLIFINGFANNPVKGLMGMDITPLFKGLKQGFEWLPETVSHIWRSLNRSPLAMHISALAGGFNMELTSIKDLEIYARGVANVDLEIFVALFDQMISYDGRPVLDRIKVPTLIISGDKDTVTPLSYQIDLHNRVCNSEFLNVPYGKHCTQLDMPDMVNLRIEKFLREKRKSPMQRAAPNPTLSK